MGKPVTLTVAFRTADQLAAIALVLLGIAVVVKALEG